MIPQVTQAEIRTISPMGSSPPECCQGGACLRALDGGVQRPTLSTENSPTPSCWKYQRRGRGNPDSQVSLRNPI